MLILCEREIVSSKTLRCIKGLPLPREDAFYRSRFWV